MCQNNHHSFDIGIGRWDVVKDSFWTFIEDTSVTTRTRVGEDIIIVSVIMFEGWNLERQKRDRIINCRHRESSTEPNGKAFLAFTGGGSLRESS